MYMSRIARELSDFLASLRIQNNLFDVLPIQEVFLMDKLACNYYMNPIKKMIQTKVKRINDVQQKHCTIDYWDRMLQNLLKYNQACKRTPYIDTVGIEHIEKYKYINSVMICDYGYNDLVLIFKMLGQADIKTIKNACKISKDNGIYSASYIHAIVTNEIGKNNLKKQNIQKLDSRIRQSDKLLDNTRKNTVLDTISAKQNWGEQLENAEIERKFNEMFGGSHT